MMVYKYHPRLLVDYKKFNSAAIFVRQSCTSRRIEIAHTKSGSGQLWWQPRLAAQFDSIDLRYLVWIDGRTSRTASAGSLGCAVGPGGGGCFGFLTWDNDASYEATVWDTQIGQTAGRISSDAEGTSYMPAFVVPLPIVARVKSNACKSLSKQIANFLSSGDA